MINRCTKLKNVDKYIGNLKMQKSNFKKSRVVRVNL